MKFILPVAAVICVALISLGVYFATRENAPGPRQVPIDSSYQQRLEKKAWTKGSSNPTVTVLEYGDLQCPACASEYGIINDAIEATKDYAQLQYRHFQIPSHNKTHLASLAAEAAGRQGKFWEMHDLLFGEQPNWTTQTATQFQNTVDSYAQNLGLNTDQFKQDLQDRTLQDPVDADIAAGNQLPVQGTPTILINGQELTQLPASAAELVKAIQDARDHAGR